MSMNGRRRVVIAGIEAVLGNDAETTWENLVAGKSGAAEIAQFDASEYPVHFACELKGFEASTSSRRSRRVAWIASRR